MAMGIILGVLPNTHRLAGRLLMVDNLGNVHVDEEIISPEEY
jgi:hypothetical protein